MRVAEDQEAGESKRENIPTYRPDDVGRFFNEKKIGTECPCCKQSLWTLFSGDDVSGLAQDILHPDHRPQRKHVWLLSIVCTNCGYLRQHALQTFLDWLKEDKTKAQEKS